MGSRMISGRFVERPEPRKISLYTTKSCSGNSGVIEMGNGPGRRKVGVCERRIEVGNILVDDNG